MIGVHACIHVHAFMRAYVIGSEKTTLFTHECIIE